jgi:hypothetical protein
VEKTPELSFGVTFGKGLGSLPEREEAKQPEETKKQPMFTGNLFQKTDLFQTNPFLKPELEPTGSLADSKDSKPKNDDLSVKLDETSASSRPEPRESNSKHALSLLESSFSNIPSPQD